MMLSLSNLLKFQEMGDPNFIWGFLKDTHEWISNDLNFDNQRNYYRWYEAKEGEEVERNTKDEISYIPDKNFKPAIMYITIDKSRFDYIYSSIKEDMVVVESIKSKRVNACVYTGSNFVIQTAEPFLPQKDNLFLYGFIVYNKEDYERGFRVK